jgi:hypothetical protein
MGPQGPLLGDLGRQVDAVAAARGFEQAHFTADVIEAEPIDGPAAFGFAEVDDATQLGGASVDPDRRHDVVDVRLHAVHRHLGWTSSRAVLPERDRKCGWTWLRPPSESVRSINAGACEKVRSRASVTRVLPLGCLRNAAKGRASARGRAQDLWS